MDVQEEIRKLIKTIPHFPKEGVQFKDITPLLESPALSRAITVEIARLFQGVNIDAVAGIESRGFLYGLPLATELNVPFIPVRKKGKLPDETVAVKYLLEYGSEELEVHRRSIKKDMNVLIHDDLLATGGTANAAASLVEMLGAKVAGFSFIIELNHLSGKKQLADYDKPIISLVKYD
ncbi:MAG: adenine phosphoribosyltransferase [Cryomorphaceae bacterium]|nr:adenine phosphoribosyltransferase [Flavobacteriales bacterium]